MRDVASILIVTGGRNYGNRKHIFSVLDEIAPDMVISGGAAGADASAEAWCRENSVMFLSLPLGNKGEYGWKLGRKAGPIRNEEMVQWAFEFAEMYQAEIIGVAFPGNSGTNDMAERILQNRIALRDERQGPRALSFAELAERRAAKGE